MEEPSTYQYIFTVFYAILYGRMLGSLDGFVPFPWDGVLRERIKTVRLILSLTILNILPFVYFIWVFGDLKELSLSLNNGIFFSLLLALGVFGFYRLYHFVLIILNDKGLFYEKSSIIPPKYNLRNILIKRDSMIFWNKSSGHLVGLIVYFIPFLLLITKAF